MKREDLKGQTFGWDGKKIYGFCKKCGEFTINTDSVLCVSCSLGCFFSDMLRLQDNIAERGVKNEAFRN